MKMARRAARRSGSPESQRLTPRRRILLAALSLAALLIAGRALQLQAVDGDYWAQIASEQQRARVPLPARRGAIYDRHGTPLALIHETFQLSVAPNELLDREAAAAALVQTLGLSAAEARRATDPERRWVVLPGRYSGEQRRQLGRMRGLHFERRLERFYPQGDIGREVIGAVSLDGRALGGIEQQFDELLRGEPGYSVQRRDGRGDAQATLSLPVVAPQEGADLYLTLDLQLQEIADGALREAMRSSGAAGGDLLLLDPRTGELLAAVSRRRGTARSLSAVTEPYEPGSTLKPLVVAAMLASGRVSLADGVDGEQGSWRLGSRTIRDVHGYDWLTLRDALRVSSNIAIIKLAGRLSHAEQYAALRDFGLGTPTGIEYPAEAGGRLRRPSQWSAMSVASLAMGYEISVTPLQLVAAYGALANEGVLMEPRLVREVRDRHGRALYELQPQPVRRVLPPEVTRELTEVLVAAVEQGTGTRASLGSFAVAGKTGTARRTGPGGRYESGSYTASFAGYFPARDPQLVILVKLDEPQGAIFGGMIAAPVTRETLQGILAARTSTLDGRGLLATRAEHPRVARRDGTPLAERAPGRDGPFVFFLSEGMPEAEGSFPARQVPIPALEGLPLRDAVRRLHALGLQVRLEGSGVVERTHPAAGELLAAGDTLRVIGRGW